MKPRKFVAVNKGKDDRKIVVVGLWEKKRQMKEKKLTNGLGTLTWQVPYYEHSLTLAKAICHPDDKFDTEKGVEIALKRIKKGESIGKLTTEDYTMLTPDHCQMIVEHKANYITANIEHYLPKEK